MLGKTLSKTKKAIVNAVKSGIRPAGNIDNVGSEVVLSLKSALKSSLKKKSTITAHMSSRRGPTFEENTPAAIISPKDNTVRISE